MRAFLKEIQDKLFFYQKSAFQSEKIIIINEDIFKSLFKYDVINNFKCVK